MSLLSINNLSVSFQTERGVVQAVDDVSFNVDAGETLAIVGESGSGKSVTALSILQLLGDAGTISDGQIVFDGQNLLDLPEREIRNIRGDRIAMIFQEPMSSLNPVLTIGKQVAEPIWLHRNKTWNQALDRAEELLKKVSIPDAKQRLDAYPHQFSGGMRQRVSIAIAMLNRPDLIIADEPTTALDVTIQGQVIHEMQKLCKKTKTALLWITHDLAVVAGISSRICVMYAGRIVEQGPNEALIGSPMHPYTNGLLGSVPSQNRRGEPLQQIEGIVPSLLDLPPGCAFENRCSHAVDECSQSAPDEMVMVDQRILRCFNRVGQNQT